MLALRSWPSTSATGHVRGWRDVTARGYFRDGKTGKLQIGYGLLTDPADRPVAVRVFPGNIGDPGRVHRHRQGGANMFGLAKMVMVGDHGMITWPP